MARSTRKRAAPPRRRRMRSMTTSDGFKAFVLDQFEELGDVTPKSMFGGVGLYHRGLFFALLARDTLYLKVDDFNRSDFENSGMKPFMPYPGKPVKMGYYSVPLEVLESPIELAAWARKAVAAARRK